MKTTTFFYRGGIERGHGSKIGYRWHDGYSASTPSGGILYPWMTRRECQQDARANGSKAVFVVPSGRVANVR